MRKHRWANRDILGFLKERENKVVCHGDLMETFDLTRMTIHKKIVALQNGYTDEYGRHQGELIAPIVYVVPGKRNNGKYIPPQFGGGIMLFNPDKATREVREMVQESCDWFLAMHKGIVRLAAQIWNTPKVRAILIPAQGHVIKQIAAGGNMT